MRKLDKLMIMMSAMALIAFALTLPSFGRNQNANSSTTQNANSSTTQNANSPRPQNANQQQDFSKNTWELPEDADKTKNPIASNPESIEKGKALFLERTKGNCIFCHGETGAGNEANLPQLRSRSLCKVRSLVLCPGSNPHAVARLAAVTAGDSSTKTGRSSRKLSESGDGKTAPDNETCTRLDPQLFEFSFDGG